jgi:hypothetical protein
MSASLTNLLIALVALLTASLGALAAFWTTRTALLQYLSQRGQAPIPPLAPL